ncbi:MAG: DUF1573 domain-containing protein [Planctomycetes bacterium]|nr:DUF1573 domain-containing protein [Planctomycetota bacterium]
MPDPLAHGLLSAIMIRRLALLVPLFLVPLLLGACGAAATPTGKGLVLLPYDGPLGRGVKERDARTNFFDFGRVPDGDNAQHVFRLRNEDPAPVSILKLDPGCGCTVAALRVIHADGSIEKGEAIHSKAPKLLTLLPGELAEIEVQISTRDMVNKNLDKLITLRVLTDSVNGYFLTLEVHILVEQPFTAVPGAIALGSIPESGGGEGKVEIVPSGGFHYELGELGTVPAGVHASLLKEIRNEFPVWTLRAGFDAPLARGPRNELLRIPTFEAEGVPGRGIEVPLTAMVVEDLASEPARLVFAAARDAAAHGTVELYSRLAGQRLRVTAVDVPEAQRAQLAARFEPVEADAEGTSRRWRITLETQPPLAETPMLSGKLLVHLDDPQHPSHELEFVVHLK